MKKSLLLLMFGVFALILHASDSLLIVNPSIKNIDSYSQGRLTFYVISKAKNKLLFKNYYELKDWSDKNSDVCILLQKKIGTQFVKIDQADNPPPELVGPKLPEFKEVRFGDTISINIELLLEYRNLKSGEYRFKLLIRSSKINPIKDIESGWLFINLKRDFE